MFPNPGRCGHHRERGRGERGTGQGRDHGISGVRFRGRARSRDQPRGLRAFRLSGSACYINGESPRPAEGRSPQASSLLGSGSHVRVASRARTGTMSRCGLGQISYIRGAFGEVVYSLDRAGKIITPLLESPARLFSCLRALVVHLAVGADALDDEGCVRYLVGSVLPDTRREVLELDAWYLGDLTAPGAPDVIVGVGVEVVADGRLRPM